MKKTLILALFSLFALLGCKEAEMNQTGQKFFLTRINDEAYTKPEPPFLEFGENAMLFGKVCNSFRGPTEFKDGRLTLKNAAATKMMCLDGELNALENTILTMLTKGAAVEFRNKTELTLKDGEKIFTFAPRE